MKFRAQIEVRLRKEQLDPEAETVKKSLADLNFQVTDVKMAKVYEVILEAKSKSEAEDIARLMCSRLLVNPVKDEFNIEVVEDGGSVSDQSAA